jgi:hypothetical protein
MWWNSYHRVWRFLAGELPRSSRRGKTALKTELCELRHDDLPQHRWRLRRFMPD